MTITGGTALSKDEIDRMIKEAEAFAAEDHKRREQAEARNQADQVAYQVDRFLSDSGDKVPEAEKTELTSANDELKEVLKDQAAETDRLRSASDKVMGIFQRVGASMYQGAQAGAGQQASAGGGGSEGTTSEDEVVEGEIVEEGGTS